jgi:hypothetical protein
LVVDDAVAVIVNPVAALFEQGTATTATVSQRLIDSAVAVVVQPVTLLEPFGDVGGLTHQLASTT